jgi:hypothetical protein
MLILIAIIFFGVFTQNEVLLKYTILMFIPVFLIVFLLKYKSLSVPFISFLVFSFLGNISSIYIKEEMFLFVPDAFYFLSFMYLLLIAIPKFKIFEVDKLIGVYLISVFLINIYLLYALYGFLISVIPDYIEVNLFIAKSLVLNILAFLSFGIYLNTQTKGSILFLVAVVCFGFSTNLDYINGYYLYDLNFIMFNRILYVIGLYLVFRYAMIDNKFSNTSIETVDKHKDYSSDNILA